jgi:hypothetical protein
MLAALLSSGRQSLSPKAKAAASIKPLFGFAQSRHQKKITFSSASIRVFAAHLRSKRKV